MISYLVPMMMDSSQQIGTFIGLAIHDTSQVMGAALTYDSVFGDEVVLKTAALTKLTRNLFLAAVVPMLAVYHRRLDAAEASRERAAADARGETQAAPASEGAAREPVKTQPFLDRLNAIVRAIVGGRIESGAGG